MYLQRRIVSYLDGEDERECHQGALAAAELLEGHGLAAAGERDAHLRGGRRREGKRDV